MPSSREYTALNLLTSTSSCSMSATQASFASVMPHSTSSIMKLSGSGPAWWSLLCRSSHFQLESCSWKTKSCRCSCRRTARAMKRSQRRKNSGRVKFSPPSTARAARNTFSAACSVRRRVLNGMLSSRLVTRKCRWPSRNHALIAMPVAAGRVINCCATVGRDAGAAGGGAAEGAGMCVAAGAALARTCAAARASSLRFFSSSFFAFFSSLSSSRAVFLLIVTWSRSFLSSMISFSRCWSSALRRASLALRSASFCALAGPLRSLRSVYHASVT